MEKNRQHQHSRFIRLFKNIFSTFALISSLFFVYILLVGWFKSPDFPLNSFLLLLFLVIFSPICILTAAYFFTDLEVDENGLLVEFLWKKLPIPWNKILQIRPLFGLKTKRAIIYVVLVDGLTLFHRLYGMLYGFSLNPAFVLWSNVSNFEILKSDIENHIHQNRKLER